MARLFSGGADADWAALVREPLPGRGGRRRAGGGAPGQRRATATSTSSSPATRRRRALYDLARSVSAQSHLGFSLDVVEVTPFVPSDGPADAIMYVPNVRLSTEIVARTAVSVTYRAGHAAAGRQHRDDQRRGDRGESGGGRAGRIAPQRTAASGPTRRSRTSSWPATIRRSAISSCSPRQRGSRAASSRTARRSRRRSASTCACGVRTAPRAVRRSSTAWTTAATRSWCISTTGRLRPCPPEDLDAFKADLRALFGSAVNVDVKDVKIAMPLLADKLDAFKEVIRKMQRRIDRAARPTLPMRWRPDARRTSSARHQRARSSSSSSPASCGRSSIACSTTTRSAWRSATAT